MSPIDRPAHQPLRDLRVLIAGVNYWPEPTGIAPYTTAMAEHLARRGARVLMLAGLPHIPDWRVPAEYRRLWQRETINGVRVRRSAHYVPRRHSAIRRALLEASFFASAAPRFARRMTPPDVVIGVVPALSGGAVAALAARRFGAPYGLIFQDLSGQAAAQSGMPGGARVARLTRALEGSLARGAAGVAVITDGFRPYLEALGVEPKRISLLPNWSHLHAPGGERAATRAALSWPPEEQIVLHAGNMGLKQALEHVIEAARQSAATQPDLRFVLMGDGNQRARLESLALGLPNVRFLDAQPAERFPEVLAAADVLLVNERATVAEMSLPSKLTSYFVAGRPVLAAVAPEGTTAREVERSGAGLVVPAEEPAALLAAIARLRNDPALAERLAGAGPGYAARALDAEAALARVERFVLRCAGQSHAAGR